MKESAMSKSRLLSEAGFLLAISLLLLVNQGFVAVQVIFLLIAIFFTGVSYLLPRKASWFFQVILLLLCTFWPELALFLPAMMRVIAPEERKDDILSLLGFLLIATVGNQSPSKIAFVILLLLVAFYLRKKEQRMSALEKKYIASKDTHWEKQQQLSQQNKVLALSQETKLALQIAEERNRIARDIHDNVGHLLSSAILQIGALEMINQEPKLNDPLANLSATVHTGMDRIRQSVHDLHETSITFQQSLEFLIADFPSSVTIEGTLFEGLNEAQQNCFLMVIKEALTNSIKHSHAKTVVLHFRTLPAFFRLQITNDGVRGSQIAKTGIGLKTMRQRVQEQQGQVHILQENQRFQLTIILPKEEHQ
jgi:signal transduction histidine kinase